MAIVFDGTNKAFHDRLARVEAKLTELEAAIDSVSIDPQTFFADLTHPAGYAAGESEFWVQGPDTTAPTVTAFVCDATSSSLVVPISSFTATDDVAVTGYKVTESATPPAADAAGWSATAPTSVTASAPGTITFYAWAKDAAGNVSASLSDSCAITIVDTTAPTVTAFDVPATSDSRTITVNTFTATDEVGVTGYMITESGTPPLASDPGWTGSAPTTYTTASDGAKTLRAWAKDAAGNVSNALTDTCTVTVAQVATPTFSPVAGTYGGTQTVTISCSTSGATIHYTTDGTAPTASSPTYSSPVSVAASGTLRALAVKSGMADSSVGSATFTILPAYADAFGSDTSAKYTAAGNAAAPSVVGGKLQFAGVGDLAYGEVYRNDVAAFQDGSIEATISGSVATQDLGLFLRFVDHDNFLLAYRNASGVTLFKKVASVFSAIGASPGYSSANNTTTPMTIRFEVVGGRAKVYVGGVLRIDEAAGLPTPASGRAGFFANVDDSPAAYGYFDDLTIVVGAVF